MFNDNENVWTSGRDLESYSFDDFYDKNESPIHNQAGFDIELSADHIPFKNDQTLTDSKMETYQSNCSSNSAKEPEDYFFLN